MPKLVYLLLSKQQFNSIFEVSKWQPFSTKQHITKKITKTRVGGRGKAMPGDQWTAATYSDVLEVEAAFRNRIHISGQLCMTKNGGLCTD